MPVNNDTLNKNLYDVLNSRGYDPVSLNSKGEPTDELEKADVFRFNFGDGASKSQAWATVEGNELVLYIDDNFTKSSDFENFTQFMKQWAQKRLLGFKITNKDHLVNDMKKRTVMRKKEDQLNEGYYAMGKKASYNDSIPTVKVIIQHTRQLEEGEQRFRNIARIFVENATGERFLVPTTRPGLARVYARHIAEGGTPYDDKAKHITALVEEYTKMAGFVRATRNGQFNESAQRLVTEGLAHYGNLRTTLQGMTSHRGYNKYFESYTPMLNEESADTATVNELFVQEKLDPRIESVLPILSRLNKNITEMSVVKELGEWADSVVEATDLKSIPEEDYSDLPPSEAARRRMDDKIKQAHSGRVERAAKAIKKYKAGDVPANAKKVDEGRDELYDSLHTVVMRRIMNHYPELLKDLDTLEMAIDNAVSSFIGDGVEEVGSSDVSAIVKNVQRYMEEYGAKIDEAPGAETLAHNQNTAKKNLKAFDLAEDSDEARELALYAENDQDLYRQSFLPIVKNLEKKFKKGTYDKDLAAKLWKYHADRAAKKYGEEHGSGDGFSIFSPAVRREVAQNLAQNHFDEMSAGNFHELEEGHSYADRPYICVHAKKGKIKVYADASYTAAQKAAEKWGLKSTAGIDAHLADVVHTPVNEGPGDEPVHPDPDSDEKRWDDVEDIEEDLDANQKRAGQLGPTEKVKNNNIGKLVGANESVEMDRLKKLSGLK